MGKRRQVEGVAAVTRERRIHFVRNTADPRLPSVCGERTGRWTTLRNSVTCTDCIRWLVAEAPASQDDDWSRHPQ